MQTALGYLETVDDDYERYVMLATDGAPNCNSSLSCSTCESTHPWGTCANDEQCLDNVETVDAAAGLLAAGYPVYVVGYNVSTD